MATKLLLIEDVEEIGRSGDIVNVRPGFARNFLLPRGLGVVADKGALRMQARLKDEREKKAIIEKQEAEKTASVIDGITLIKIVKVDQEGHMYGSVSAHDVAEMLQAQSNIALEKRNIGLKHAVKETGSHKITIKLKEGVSAHITLKVVSEEEHAAGEPAPAVEEA